jgi:hypothetical protein
MKTFHSGDLRSDGSAVAPADAAAFFACTASQISLVPYSERSRSWGVTCWRSSMFCSLRTFSRIVQWSSTSCASLLDASGIARAERSRANHEFDAPWSIGSIVIA